MLHNDFNWFRLLPVAAVVFLLAYLVGYWRRKRDEEVAVEGPDPWAEDWSGVNPDDRNPPLRFAATKVGDQFVIDAELGGYVFERVHVTEEGNNARCDLYDTFVHDSEVITRVSLQMRVR